MSMSNAQAALIAAANAAVRGTAVPLEPVLKRAAAYLHWLDEQDSPPAEDINLASIRELHKPNSIVQCADVSAHGTRCLLASEHGGTHRNSEVGTFWPNADDPVPGVHFYTGPEHPYAPCGEFMFNDSPVTTQVGNVTCPSCREALGL